MNKYRYKIKRSFLVFSVWLLIGVFVTVINYWVQSKSIRFFILPFDFVTNLWTNIMSAASAAVIYTSFEFFILGGIFKRLSFGVMVFIKTMVFVLIFLLVLVGSSLFFHAIDKDVGFFSAAAWEGAREYLTGAGPIINFILWGLVIFFTNIFIQISNIFGHGVLTKFILGKYHHPKEEQRIFMFLDIRSSTELAEKLGHLEYHALLNDFFRDVSDPVLYSYGEIYQYVGDEVTVSWDLEKGVRDDRCVNCFFDIKDTIKKNRSYYLSRYGIVPEFKAGFHAGNVTTGEVGGNKKEIVYSGDVLNTASRIQAECNKLDVDLLVSESLAGMLDLKYYRLNRIGEIELRGKSSPVTLLQISRP